MPPDPFPPPISTLELELTPLDQPCPVFAGPDPAPDVLDSVRGGDSVIALDLHNESGSWVQVRTKKGTVGWCHLSGLVPTLAAGLPWVRTAQAEVGTSMTRDKHRIQGYIDSVPGQKNKWVNEWCGCFMAWCMKRSGGEVIEVLPERAQRWLRWGKAREGQVPGQVPGSAVIGDLAIGQNGGEADTRGHVAFYLGTNGKQVLVLGGNQSAVPLQIGGEKSVRYSWYPLESTDPPARLLSVNGPP